MDSWKRQLRYDPTRALLASRNESVQYFTRRDLLDENPGPGDILSKQVAAQKIIQSQQANGSWRYQGVRQQVRSREDYDQIETFRVLRLLIEQYCMTRQHPALEKAAEFMFSRQTEQGDFRGIAGNQHVPYYSGAIMELLIKAGYQYDPRIVEGFYWLLSIRQEDGGWAFPLRTVGRKLDAKIFQSKTILPDRSKPFSHLVTGMVLRAFAAHHTRRESSEAKHAASLLASRFFHPDKYPDRQNASFWTSFSFPFWFTDLISALDSISRINPGDLGGNVGKGIGWLQSHQGRDGLWRLRLRIMAREEKPEEWITLAISRILKRYSPA